MTKKNKKGSKKNLTKRSTNAIKMTKERDNKRREKGKQKERVEREQKKIIKKRGKKPD